MVSTENVEPNRSIASLGACLRAARRDSGLTLDEVARAARCAKSYLSEIENDRRVHPPSLALLARLETVLGLPRGRLVLLAQWQATPGAVKQRVIELEAERALAERAASILKKEGIDAAYRSGALRRLVEQMARGGSRGNGEDGASAGEGGREAPPRGAARRSGDSEGELASGEWSNARVVPLPVQVPVINKVAAGYPREFTDLGYPARVADEYVSVPDVYDADAFGARVVGDSMEPEYHEGDLVVFSPQADAVNGNDCFVRFDPDGSAETGSTFKRVYFERDASGREVIRLQPLNPAYPARIVAREAVGGVYAAVYVVRAVGGKAGRR